MSFKLTVTGQVSLIDETTENVLIPFNLEDMFTTITGASHQLTDYIPLDSSMGAVTLPANNLAGIRFALIWPIGGTVTFKHGGNPVGVEINGAQIVQGVFGTPTVSTASTSTITVRYLFVE